MSLEVHVMSEMKNKLSQLCRTLSKNMGISISLSTVLLETSSVLLINCPQMHSKLL